MDLKQLCMIDAPSGNEAALRTLLAEEAKKLCGEEQVRIDRMGNLLCSKKGTGSGHPHICVSAHMDEVGFLIMSATEEGLLRFRPIGSIDARVIISKKVTVGTKRLPGVIGAIAIHLQTWEDRQRVLDYDHLYIDIGAKDKQEALSVCPPGSYACFDSPYMPMGDGFICAKALDDRAGCNNLLELMRDRYPGDVTFAFVVQEEIGMRGSAGAAFSLRPDMVINLEATAAGDMGDAKPEETVCRAGKGTAVSFMDNSSIYQRKLVQRILTLANQYDILCQIKRGVTARNDAASYQRTAGGAQVCTLSVPCRYIHSGSSVCSLQDIKAQYALTKALLMHS